MLPWVMENLGTILLASALACVIAVIVIKMIRDRKKGRTTCGCGCSHCTNSCSEKHK